MNRVQKAYINEVKIYVTKKSYIGAWAFVYNIKDIPEVSFSVLNKILMSGYYRPTWICFFASILA
jgi:hypothetical protein